MTASGIRDALLDGEWTQGSVLPTALRTHVRWSGVSAEVPDDAVIVVISHDCDLLHDSVENEPVIEVVAGSRTVAADSNNFHAKNPRRLNVEVAVSGSSIELVCLEMRWRGVIDRQRLVGTRASIAGIRGFALRTLTTWLSRRYERPALPDELIRRLDAKGGLSKLRKLLGKAMNGQPLGVFIALRDDQLRQELPPSVPYQLSLVVVLEGVLKAGDEDWDKFGTEVFAPVLNFFKGVSGVEVIAPVLISEQDLPYRQRRVFLTRLDLDSISLASEGESALPKDP